MIVTKITDRIKPPPPTTYSPTTYPITPSQPGLYQETMRRDGVIKDLVKNFKHKVGDKVKPFKEQDLEKWGECTILSIVPSYMYLERDFKWPANNNPMIVTASSDNGEIFYATTNYFQE